MGQEGSLRVWLTELGDQQAANSVNVQQDTRDRGSMQTTGDSHVVSAIITQRLVMGYFLATVQIDHHT